MNPDLNAILRALPSVTDLITDEEVKEWLRSLPRKSVLAAIRSAIDEARDHILKESLGESRGEWTDHQNLIARTEAFLLRRSMPSLRRIINATGIVLHTGLGRAPLSNAVVEAITEGAGGYCNLEYDLETGKRGRRVDHVVDLLTEITEAESATVVNNNAAATLLILHALADGREVIVSRGQLVEIGGSFRLPDIMLAGGAQLREVGTTNRTRLTDYENAINGKTAMLLRVHTSNYRMVGFTQDVPIDELTRLAHGHGLITVDDLGSGALYDLSPFGLPYEPTVDRSLKAGADLVCFSGDKLLGGPQCGIIVGQKPLIARIESHPLYRTFRVDKLILLALEATLRLIRDADEQPPDITTLTLLAVDLDTLSQRAKNLAHRFAQVAPDEDFIVCSDVAYAGGGSLPGSEIQSVVVQWRPQSATADEVAAALRQGDVPVITRIKDDAVCFDLRTILKDDEEPLISAVSEVFWQCDPDHETDKIEPRP